MSLGLSSMGLEFKIMGSLDGVHTLAPLLSGRPLVCLRRFRSQWVSHGWAFSIQPFLPFLLQFPFFNALYS